jgi:hypothetical protein
VDLGAADPGVELEQVLEKPDAGHAVDARHMKGHATGAVIREVKELTFHLGIVQESPVGSLAGGADLDARVPVQIVEVPEPALLEEIVHGEAAVTAEDLVVALDGGPATRGSAVVAVGDGRGTGLGGAFHHLGSATVFVKRTT